MQGRRIEDWNDAYANAPNIPRGERWPDAWVEPARHYRDSMVSAGRAQLDIAYGERSRNRYDLFLPQGETRGLVVYVHGGFWLRLDRSLWSHLAAGAIEHGQAVAMPSYTLCPDISLTEIVEEVGRFLAAVARRVAGPIRLVGHSAGGHLVTRMICSGSPLEPEISERIRHVMSLSGIHDLRPIMKTDMNAKLRLDEAEAIAQSPALLRPRPEARVTCWVGAMERAEFIRQNALLANIWTGLGAAMREIVEPDRHHFDVIDGLCDAGGPMIRTLLSD